ncbi:MAG: ABC transporter substrate-binding protein [Paludibacter sp.]|nr:ABC transporter substrate-binding protein [Paludibacter sp.]
MVRNILSVFFISLFFSLTSCHNKPADKLSVTPVDSLVPSYASGFYIRYFNDFKEVVVKNPWDKAVVFSKYYLIKNDTVRTPTDGDRIIIPVKTTAVTSSTHFEFLHLLNELDKVKGVCSPDLIYNAFIRERYIDGKIENLGDAFNINVEKTLKLQPEMLIMSGYKQDDPYAKRVIQAGIPVVYNNEWMENSLLARAEWIKFVAVFFDKEVKADSIFKSIEENYQSVKSIAQAGAQHPAIMSGSNFRGTWYMPGGRSFMAQLFADAGGDYYYANDTTKGSLPLNVESVLKVFSNTDIWLNCNFSTIDELLQTDKKHALFQPVKNRRVYNFNKRMLPSGANDFWESAVARPDLLLMDVISILHPGLLPGHQLIYAKQLK